MHSTPCEVIKQELSGKKVLLIAYKISVGEGSEPGAGWTSLLGHLICGSNVHLISTSDNIANLNLPSEFVEQFNFSSIDIDKKRLRIPDKLPFSEQINYFFWNFKARKYIIRLHSTKKFDIIHQSTFAGDWNPSCILWNLPGSLYWGPIGGTQKVPFKAYRWLGITGCLSEFVRIIITSPLRFLNRILAAKNKVHVLVANKATSDYFSKKCNVAWANQIVLEHVSIGDFHLENVNPNILLGSGRLIDWKMWPIAIKSASQTKRNFINFSIYGEGKARKRLEKMIMKMGLSKLITINSKIPRDKLLDLLKICGVYVFPSMKDSSAWSLAEAVHFGVPIAAFNVPGICEMISDPNSNLASISGNLVDNLSKKIEQPYKAERKNSFCVCKIRNQYKEIFYEC